MSDIWDKDSVDLNEQPILDPNVTVNGQQPVMNPQMPYGQVPVQGAQVPYGQAPYGQVPVQGAQVPYGQAPYGQVPVQGAQVPYGQAPYGQVPMQGAQVPYGQVPYGQMPYGQATKYCQNCGSVIPAAAVICTACGCQVAEFRSQPQSIIINNANNNMNMVGYGKPKNKWVAFLLCLFFGYIGVHKFYEGKVLSGLIYLFTLGFGGIGWLIDCLILLFKPNPYYV